jgi:hypothetical protein
LEVFNSRKLKVMDEWIKTELRCFAPPCPSFWINTRTGETTNTDPYKIGNSNGNNKTVALVIGGLAVTGLITYLVMKD